jgi:hypothetical protein
MNQYYYYYYYYSLIEFIEFLRIPIVTSFNYWNYESISEYVTNLR